MSDQLKIVELRKKIAESHDNIEKLRAKKDSEYRSVQEFGKGDFTETNRVLKVLGELHKEIEIEKTSIKRNTTAIKKLQEPSEDENDRRSRLKEFHSR
jgi:DNA repair protein RadC